MQKLRLTRNNILFVLGIVIPIVLVFFPLFADRSISFGDAPYFYPKGLSELLSEPYAWTNRGESFGGVDPRIWIWPILVLFGALGKLGMASDHIVRLIFYLPVLVLATTGPILVARKLGYGKIVQFFASIFYLLNTYFLLLVDGGQVGIVLAYGIFPFTLIFLIEQFRRPSFLGWFKALILLQVLTIADPRVSIISLLTSVTFVLIDKKKGWWRMFKSLLKSLFLILIAWTGLNAYWIIPLLKIKQGSLSLAVSGLGFLSLLNGFFLYQPHWPENIFGVVTFPSWYFVGLPLMIFGILLFRIKKSDLRWMLIFLLFAFLLKGSTPPLGGLYDFLVGLPMGSAFRDSSKFFIPLMLIAGVLIGRFVEEVTGIGKLRKHTWLKCAVGIGAYTYLLFLILPAIMGNMNFVLSSRDHVGDYQIIAENIEKSDNFSRTAWIPERHPLAYQTHVNPAVDGKNLSDYRPFEIMNTGSFDRFNFINNPEFVDWLKVLGIRYVVLPGDQRVVDPTDEELELWRKLNMLVADSEGLNNLDWADTPVYEVPEVFPRIYSVDQMALVVGPEIQSEKGIIIPSVYFEDGKLDTDILQQKIDGDSATIIFNGKDEVDLKMSFLQDYYVGQDEVFSSDWAQYLSSEFLTSKYQLLIRGVDNREFDYGKGIAMSTEAGEQLEFELEAQEGQDYILAVRYLVDSMDSKMDFTIGGNSGETINERIGQYDWFTSGVKLPEGVHKLTLTNGGGLKTVNVVALIPGSQWNEAQKTTDVFVQHFGISDPEEFETNVLTDWVSVDHNQRYPTWYDFEAPADGGWLILTDNYHPDWKLNMKHKEIDSVPVYSMVNGFYVAPNMTKTSIRFIGQEQVRWGLWLSALTFLGLSIIFLWYYPGKSSK